MDAIADTSIFWASFVLTVGLLGLAVVVVWEVQSVLAQNKRRAHRRKKRRPATRR